MIISPDICITVEDYLFALGDKSPNTRKSAKRLLRQFLDWCADQDLCKLDQVKAVHIRKYTAYLRDRQLADNTVQAHIRRIKAWLNWCAREDEYDDLISPKTLRNIEVPKAEQKVMNIIGKEAFERLYAACEGTDFCKRNQAILCLLMDTGVRVSELCGLMLSQVHITEDDSYIRVYGKGRKEREVDFGPRTRKVLRGYITRYRKTVKSEQHVFLSYQHGPLTVTGVEQALNMIADKAGVHGIHPHLFRHSYAVGRLKSGTDVYRLSRLLVHASVAITEHYLRAFKASDARTGNISVLDNL